MRIAPFVPLALLAAPLPAQAGWSLLYPTVSPPARIFASFPTHERLGRSALLFGWAAVAGSQATDAWVFDGAAWSATAGALPAWRLQPAITFDAARDEVVLFGGGSVVPFDDTWRWNGFTWTLASPAVSPSARTGAPMAFDRQRNVAVLFGGRQPSGSVILGDTWEWNGSTWQQRFPVVSPPNREAALMAFDPVGGGVLLHSGVGDQGSGILFADTWSFDGTTWTQRFPTVSPPYRISARMVTDLHRQRVLLLGGEGGDPFAWEWNGTQWNVSYQPSPAPRHNHGMGYDASQRRVVVHGGSITVGGIGYHFNDTWQYRTPAPADVVPFGNGCPGSAGTPSLAAAPFTLPWIGDTTRHVVTAVPAGQSGAFFVSGVGAVAPLSLGVCGMPGCELLVALDVCEFQTAVGGAAAWAKTIPLAMSLAGASFEQQAFVLDPRANATGLVVSNAIRVVVGVR